MKNRIYFLILLFNFLILSFGSVHSQDLKAISTIDTNKALIGDQLKLRIGVNYLKDINFVFPDLRDSIGGLLIVSKSKIDTIRKEEKIISLEQEILLTQFDTGRYQIPPLTFMYEKKGFPSLYPLATDSLEVHFYTMEVDTSKAFMDIKDVVDAPIDWWEYVPYLVALLAILIASYFAWNWWKKRKKDVSELPKFDPKIPPHVMAMEALSKLENEKLWQNGKYKLYYSELTDILRVYLHRRYDLHSLEMTSPELISAIMDLKLNNDLVDKMNFVLATADLAKFAKGEPLAIENTNALDFVRLFVVQTKRLDENNAIKGV